MADMTIGGRRIYPDGTSPELIQQAARLVAQLWPELGEPVCTLEGEPLEETGRVPAKMTFTAREGVEAVLREDAAEGVFMGVALRPAQKLVPVDTILSAASALGRAWHWTGGPAGAGGLCFSRSFGPRDFMGVHQGAFRAHLEQIKLTADAICPPVSAARDEEAVRALYAKVEEALAPVFPWAEGAAAPEEAHRWAEDAAELLTGGVSIGVTAEHREEQDLALALIAGHTMRAGGSIGLMRQPSIDTDRLLRLAAAAPGHVALAARSFRMATNPYEMSNESVNLLSGLAAAGVSCVFFGTHEELQTVFSGGQGGKSDPLNPAVFTFPGVPLETLVHHAACRQARDAGMTSPAVILGIRREAMEALGQEEALENPARLVGHTVRRAIRALTKSGGGTGGFVRRAGRRAETFGGLQGRTRSRRRHDAQRHFQQGVCDPGFPAYLKGRLLGQDEALEKFVEKLCDEALTRSEHQPFRLALQGTPGIGKSDSLVLLAEWLKVPYVVIDAAAMPDPHMATTQLLGSGLGFVGSYKSGRIEQAAKHFQPVIVEIADLDHATAPVRAALGDLFLQILETGEAQSAAGGMFSCANLLLAFTLNLPGGKDEKLHQRMGFGGPPSQAEVRRDVLREIKEMVSGAFLSRLGGPVIYAPLTGGVRAQIAGRVLVSAARTGLARLGYGDVRVSLAPGTAERLVAGPDSGALTFGARGLAEVARNAASGAVLRAWRDGWLRPDGAVGLAHGADGRLEISPERGDGTDTTVRPADDRMAAD